MLVSSNYAKNYASTIYKSLVWVFMNVFSTKQARSHKNFESFNTAAEWRGPDLKDADRTTGAQAIFSHRMS